MEHLLSLHLKKFNDRVKVMNQTNSRDLVLTAAEARQLQADLFDLLTKINDLVEVKQQSKEEPIVQVTMQGGKF